MIKGSFLPGKIYRNFIGMEFVEISHGYFIMGQDSGGDIDESPAHVVNITIPFYMAISEVTNAQYEQFDPSHVKYRGIKGVSLNDDEAVTFVSWYDANRFCDWLSQNDSNNYRLPTEAEWEYACRAGTNTLYYTGDILPEIYHKNQKNTWDNKPVSLKTCKTPANSWGLFDMHGNLEEWCSDWYGLYPAYEQTDPVGYIDGVFKVTRGGSHNSDIRYLRSANRLGTLPEDKNWFIGLRIVIGDDPGSRFLKTINSPLWARGVKQKNINWHDTESTNKPYFKGPIHYIHRPKNPETVPLYSHNHCPSITWCDNGDLLAIWYSCETEAGREMTILASRLRHGSDVWDMPTEFFKAPDRNMTGSSLLNNRKGTIFHFNGLDTGYGWGNQLLVMRRSTDNGVTWTKPYMLNQYHQHHNTPISGTIITDVGTILQLCDENPWEKGGSVVHASEDGGENWKDLGEGKSQLSYKEGEMGALIAGIHAGIVSLNDGKIIALGRGNNINGRMPLSVSTNRGITWKYFASEFPPISSCQRLAMIRLNEGPILLVSFTDPSTKWKNNEWFEAEGMMSINSSGIEQKIYGSFSALSYDEGKTWPVKSIMSPENFNGKVKGDLWTGEFILDSNHAEPAGYLAVTQSPDNLIHLISSSLYYRFNLSWLERYKFDEKSIKCNQMC